MSVLLPYEITLFSNNKNCGSKNGHVLLPYEITLFSNKGWINNAVANVLLPYEITLFSNKRSEPIMNGEFYYLMKLHYSQTIVISASLASMFYYLMKLHYSQTTVSPFGSTMTVLLPYEITLFSNR